MAQSADVRALLVVDVQGSFESIAFDADGVLARLGELIDAFEELVVWTRQRLADRIPPIHPRIAPREAHAPVIDKDSPDAFLGTDLDELLRARGVRTVLVAGFATEACVDSTARSALSHGYDVVLVADCHTTTIERGADPVGASAVIAHVNATFAKLQYAGRRIEVRAAAELRAPFPRGR